MSYYKYDEIKDTTACYSTCSFTSNKVQDRLLKQQVSLSSLTYFIYGAWGWKICISVLFALLIGTQNSFYFELSSPKTFGWYNCSYISFSIVMKLYLSSYLQ